jgi:hypothetical protein
MITKLSIERHSDGQVFAKVQTDNGGDQSYGPWCDMDAAKSALRSIVENDFEETFRESDVQISGPLAP